TLPPHPRRWLGLRPLLRIRDRTPSRATRLAALLQSSQAPLRDRRRPHQQTQQPAWTSQLEDAGVRAAVDEQTLPRDVAGLLGAQERARRAELLRGAETSRRDPFGTLGRHRLGGDAAFLGLTRVQGAQPVG